MIIWNTSIIKQFCFISLLVVLTGGCNNGFLNFISKKTAWEEYSNKLVSSGIANTELGKEWLEAGSDILQRSPEVEAPFNITGLFLKDEVVALAWKFNEVRGTTLEVEIQWDSPDSTRLFVDLFKTGERQAVASLKDNETLLQYELMESGRFILRIQPELLGRGSFTVSLKRKPAYAVFPIQGKNSKAIWSFWGDPRDGGKRKHEGIDIFADRGTPVISPMKGIVTSVRNGGLGGKSVFVRDNKRGVTLYFAHLDSQYVRLGRTLKPGDTIGTVGNTGNARHTRPHLHFGIYSGYRGAIDPLPFVNDEKQNLSPLTRPFTNSRLLVVNGPNANFREGPGTKYPKTVVLKKNNLLIPRARNDDWYLVETPDNTLGYIHHSLLMAPQKKEIEISGEDWFFWDPFKNPGDSLQYNLGNAQTLGYFNNFELIEGRRGEQVWRRTNS